MRDEAQEVSFSVLVMYPTDVASSPTLFGPYSLDVSIDGPVFGGPYPLVVISHGNGGSHLLYRTIGAHLARHGYVVALPEHPGNNRNDNSLEGTLQNLVNRPRHIRMTIDTVLGNADLQGAVEKDKVAVVGHSLGGYTALALAGGTPWTKERCRVDVVADPRLRALVLLAPATPWFMPEGSLAHVRVPILMLSAEHDPYTPLWHAEIVLKGVPDPSRVTHRVVENAGHFSFLSPFPPRLKGPRFPPSMDPEGFDREAFHQVLPEEIRGYLERVMQA